MNDVYIGDISKHEPFSQANTFLQVSWSCFRGLLSGESFVVWRISGGL